MALSADASHRRSLLLKVDCTLPESELYERLLRRSFRVLPEPTPGKEPPQVPSQSLAGIPNSVQRAPDLRPENLLTLQRMVGNQAVQRMLAQQQSAPSASRERSPRHIKVPTTNSPTQTITKTSASLLAQRGSKLMRAPHNAPPHNVKSRAPSNHIQRAGNWDKFKGFAKGQGKGFRDDQQWWLDEMNPSNNKGVGKVAKPALAAPFAALQMGMSGVGRGVATLGAGAYYGAKGIGSGIKSLGGNISRGAKSLGGSIKSAYNKDRNPHGYNRNRLPATADTALEMGKPAGALGVSGATLGASEAAGTGTGLPAGVGMLNLLTAADAALTWRNGSKMADEARQRNDMAGIKVGTRKANQGKWGVMGGVAGTAQGALNLGTAVDVGSQGLMSANDLLSGANYVSSGLGIAGAATGIAGGAVTMGQGLWKTGKALSKWRKLSKSAPMLTPDGERWRAHIKNREKTKAGLNTLKTIGGALGIAAGALVIASNPIGWALGIAAAATVGGLFAGKLYTKWKKSRRKQKAKKEVRAEMEQEEMEQEAMERERPNDMPELEDMEDENEEQVQGHDEAGMQDANPSKLDQAKRKQANELGNRVAQKVSKSGKVAGEIRGALSARSDPMVGMLIEDLEQKHFTHEFLRKNNVKDYPYPKRVLRVHDALVMMSVLNLTPEEVESNSGQELIEKKLSVSDSL